jgi:hypothetical protein
MDLQVGGSSRFNVTKNGNTAINGGFSSGGSIRAGSNSTAIEFTTNGVNTRASGLFSWSATTSGLDAADTILGRRGERNLRLGAADAATALAQTFSVQSVVAGTTNGAGANFTITGSQGTGSGAGGSIIFQVAPAGTAGNPAQNTLVNALTIGSDRRVTVAENIVGPLGNTGAVLGGLVLGFAAVSAAQIAGGQLQLFEAGSLRFRITDTQISMYASAELSWSSTASASGTPDVRLFRDAANTLALRNGTNAQEFRVYETTTGTIYKAILGNRQLIKISGAAFDNGAGANAGTLTNSPVTGNPTKWIPIDDNGTTRYIPAW